MMGGKCKSPEALARVAETSRVWHKLHDSKYLHAAKLRKHNLSQQGYDILLGKQEGVCPVCKCPLIPTSGRSGETVSIDHDHSCCPGMFSCGACVRGLLHLKCNAALGGLGDNATRCRNAAEYLERSNR